MVVPNAADQDTAPAFPLTVYYDAACPLCVEEMQVLGRHIPDADWQRVDCRAVSADDPALRSAGITPAALQARLHARDAQGRWLSGPVVFDALYRRAGLLRMARLWSGPVMRPLSSLLYPVIAWSRPLLRRIGGVWLMRALSAWAERGPRR